MRKTNILLVDNYDSFTYNLQHMLLLFPGVDLTVKRNDEDLPTAIAHGNFNGVVIGPGPGSPEDESYFGYNRQIILEYGTAGLPVLGVCLGFQGIYHSFGGSLKVSAAPMHGKTSELLISIETSKLLQGVANQTQVMRYHSIIADLSKPIPDCLQLTAYADEACLQTDSLQEKSQVHASFQKRFHQEQLHQKHPLELMAIEHKQHPIYGVQFHPESFATVCGMQIIKNFIESLSERA